uniref:Calcineurin-like phosphoesterase n=1 Tax=viral metagenome TaxID=1070528 RepID=A0A6M3LJA3_9ZZZZ
MKVIEYHSVVNSRSDVITLVPLGDIHLGTRNCDEELLQQEVDFIRATDNCYWIGMGDYIEAIKARVDKRMDFRTLAEWITTKDLADLVRVQADKFLEYVYPIRHKCMGLIVGNHEKKVEMRDDQGIVDYLAVSLGTKNLGDCAMVRWSITRKVNTKSKSPSIAIDVYTNHGIGGGRYVGSKINKIISMCIGFDADLFLMGHVHEKLVHEIPRLQINGHGDNVRLIDNNRYFILTGAFLRAYQQDSHSYAESKMYNPTALGTIHIMIKPFPQKKLGHDESPEHRPPKIWVNQ